MSPAPDHCCLTRSGFPRVSGDEPLAGIPSTSVSVFSPRERG